MYFNSEEFQVLTSEVVTHCAKNEKKLVYQNIVIPRTSIINCTNFSDISSLCHHKPNY